MPATTRIRVAFVDQVGGTPGGAERTLATFLKFAPPDLECIAVLFEDGRFAAELRDLGIVVEILAAPSSIASATREGQSLAALIQTPRMVGRLVAVLRKHELNLIYTNSMKAHLLGSASARLLGKPCVMHFHDLFSGAALQTLRAFAAWGSRERIACSTSVAQDMGLGKTTVIYGPVEVAAYDTLDSRESARSKLGIDDDLPLVGLIGRINRWKGHDRFVRIAARVNRFMPVRFAIIGAPVFRDEAFVPELYRLVTELGIEHRMTFQPWVEDVRSVYPAIDINANCSTREPFGRTIAEAGAARIPTVCFADSGAAEAIVDGVNGRTIAPGDEEGFARAIVETLVNPIRRQEMASAARETALRFDATKIAAEMAAVIRSAAA